jgi:hypothetical protein
MARISPNLWMRLSLIFWFLTISFNSHVPIACQGCFTVEPIKRRVSLWNDPLIARDIMSRPKTWRGLGWVPVQHKLCENPNKKCHTNKTKYICWWMIEIRVSGKIRDFKLSDHCPKQVTGQLKNGQNSQCFALLNQNRLLLNKKSG